MIANAESSRTVVVAGDTAFVRDRFKTALERGGHRVLSALTAGDLVGQVRTQLERIHLVILDLTLPQAQGVALVRELRAIDRARPTIVVFSGTIASAEDVRELSALGVSGYVNEYTATQHILAALAPYLFPGSANRRSSPRVELGIPITYRIGNTIASVVMVDISHGGLAIRTTSLLDIATTVKVHFRLPGTEKEVDAEAAIAWADRQIGMGMQFTNIAPADQIFVDQFVESHFFSNRTA